MAKKMRAYCGQCENRLMAEIPFYDEVDYKLYGCRKPKNHKFKGTTLKPCKDFQSYLLSIGDP